MIPIASIFLTMAQIIVNHALANGHQPPAPKEHDVGKIDDANRKLAVRALHASMGERCPLSLPEYAELLATWEVIPVIDQTEVIGAVIRKGNEVHVGMNRRPRGSARWLINEALRKTIALHGFAYTTVRRDNPAGLAFCKRLGFEVTAYDQDTDHLTCIYPTHARGGATLKGKTHEP